MDKIKPFFVGRHLNEDNDLFEKARAIMLYRFLAAFAILYVIPIWPFYSLGFNKALIKHSIDLIIIVTLLFTFKYFKSLDLVIIFFFTISFFSYLIGFMMLNPEKIDTISILWSTFFFVLGALLLNGIARILYCCLLGWIPILYVILNIHLDGALTVPFLVENIQTEPPLVVLFIPIVMIIISVWSHTSTIGEARKIITLQKELLQVKNKDITDSITYAKQIQQAKLPDLNEFSSLFPQSFILFKPKDIVSGDFYFFHKNERTVFVAAADCTGHGVPGAILSMICSEKLEDAVSKSTDTSEILNQLNKAIKTTLRQSGTDNSTRDGMDIALCSVDSVTRIVKYSGANRPFWIIRNGQKTIEEIKGTKNAIGGLTLDNQHFNCNEIKLEQGDTFYIFTDGYADQFNGKTGKKIMTKKFKDILLDIQPKTMQEQEKYLDYFVENWKAGTEQVDDILIIGVRL